jgi:hypothetical protein
MSEDNKEQGVEERSGGKGVAVGITEHPLYGLGVKLLVTDINNNKCELFLTIDEAINFAGRFSSVANLAFVLGQMAGMVQGVQSINSDSKIIAP